MPKRPLRVQGEMDADPSGKRARLQSVINVTSQQSLRAIMQALSDDALSRATATDISHARFANMKMVMKLQAGGEGAAVDVEVCDPNLMLSRIVSEVPILQRWFAEALKRKPCSREQPWRLLVAWDEFAPGNKLKVDNRRKVMNLCFSFEELGSALSCDVAWFTPVALRKTVMDQVAGGWSVILRRFLEHMLLSSGGLLSAAGVALDLGDGTTAQLFASPHSLLSDGDGLRIALQWMGHASTKPCFRHWNVFRKGGDYAEAQHDWVDIACCSHVAMKLWTEHDFRQAVDLCCEAGLRRDRGEMPEAKNTVVHQSMGFRTTPDGLLAEGPLRGIVKWTEVLRHDWVHTFLANGTVTSDAWSLIAACESHGLATQQDIQRFLKENWQSPKHRRGQGCWPNVQLHFVGKA